MEKKLINKKLSAISAIAVCIGLLLQGQANARTSGYAAELLSATIITGSVDGSNDFIDRRTFISQGVSMTKSVTLELIGSDVSNGVWAGIFWCDDNSEPALNSAFCANGELQQSIQVNAGADSVLPQTETLQVVSKRVYRVSVQAHGPVNNCDNLLASEKCSFYGAVVGQPAYKLSLQ